MTSRLQNQLKHFDNSSKRQKNVSENRRKKTQVLKTGGDQSGLLSKISLTNTRPMLVALRSISTNVKITKL